MRASFSNSMHNLIPRCVCVFQDQKIIEMCSRMHILDTRWRCVNGTNALKYLSADLAGCVVPLTTPTHMSTHYGGF